MAALGLACAELILPSCSLKTKFLHKLKWQNYIFWSISYKWKKCPDWLFLFLHNFCIDSVARIAWFVVLMWLMCLLDDA